jgi:hypothetical protein
MMLGSQRRVGRPPIKKDDKMSLGMDYVVFVTEGESMGFVNVWGLQHKLLSQVKRDGACCMQCVMLMMMR